MIKKNKFRCPNDTCKKYFETEAKLNTHLKLIHRQDTSDALIEKDDKPYKCGFEDCIYSTHSEKGLKQHRTIMNHGGEPSRSTKYHRAAMARKVATDDPEVAKEEDDYQGALTKIVQENIRLNADLAKVNEENDTLSNECDKLTEQLNAIQRERQELEHINTVGQINPMVYEKLARQVNGDPEGKTEEARMGLAKCYAQAVKTNAALEEDLRLARQGLIPDAWIKEIKADLSTSIDMIVAGMSNTVKERSKVVKFNELMKLLKEETDE